MSSPSLQASLEQQASRLYDLYERKAGRLRTALIGVTGLVAIVFVLVFYPYATFRGLRYALEAELAALQADSAEAGRLAKESVALVEQFRPLVQAAMQELSDVRLDAIAAAAPNHDREMAAAREAIGDDPRFAPWLTGADADRELPAELRRAHGELLDQRDRPCFWRTGEAWLRCRLRTDLDGAHHRASEPFMRKRISHLRNELFVPLHAALGKLNDSFGTHLMGDEAVWRPNMGEIAKGLSKRHYDHFAARGQPLDGPVGEVAGDLRTRLNGFSHLYDQLLEAHERFLYEARSDLDHAFRELERRRERRESDLATVDARLEEMKGLQDIQTPFGMLPVGLNELTLLFPVLLAAGFMLCTSLFVESLMLRREYHRLTRATDPEGAVMPDQRVALIAPLWIDPLQPVGNRIYRAVIMALPVAAGIASFGLLLHNGLLSGPFMVEARLSPFIYMALYAGSALVTIEGGRRIWRALSGYAGAAG